MLNKKVYYHMNLCNFHLTNQIPYCKWGMKLMVDMLHKKVYYCMYKGNRHYINKCQVTSYTLGWWRSCWAICFRKAYIRAFPTWLKISNIANEARCRWRTCHTINFTYTNIYAITSWFIKSSSKSEACTWWRTCSTINFPNAYTCAFSV